MANKQATIKEVAEYAGVSIATVSRALNGNSYVKKETYDAIMKAIHDLEYRKRQDNTRDRKRVILIILPDLENPFYSKIVQGIMSAAKGKDFSCLFYIESDIDTSCDAVLRAIDAIYPMGIITMSPTLENETLQRLESFAPVVQCTEFNDRSDTSFVSIDDYLCSKSLVEYMISRGKKRLAILNGPKKFKYSRERYRAFSDAIKEAGLELNPQFVANLPNITLSPALSVATQLLSLPNRPDAFFCSSDIFAAAVIKSAAKLKISIPDELGVVGFDNTYITNLSHPSITSINQPQFEIGFTACEVLIEHINNPASRHQHIYMGTELVIRDSL